MLKGVISSRGLIPGTISLPKDLLCWKDFLPRDFRRNDNFFRAVLQQNAVSKLGKGDVSHGQMFRAER